MNLDVPQVTLEELQKRSLFIGMPCYGGQMSSATTQCLKDLAVFFTQHGVRFHVEFLNNESLIQRARNYLADSFLRSDFTHMMFIDSDIAFRPKDVMDLLAIQSDESEYDIIGAAYPKKTIAWEKVVKAVELGKGDEDPNQLSRFVGDFVFNPKARGSISLNKPCEVSELGTGFMMIRRKTFDNLKEFMPEYSYKPDHVRTEHFDGSREIMAYFHCEIHPESKRLLSEDYFFCWKTTQAGMKVWLCPWMPLAHSGSYVFSGSILDLAEINTSLTANPADLKKKKSKDGK